MGRDIWALGLVLLSVLLGKVERANFKFKGKATFALIAPLQCLKKCIEPSLFKRSFKNVDKSNYVEEDVINLSQETLDQELVKLQKEAEQLHPENSLIMNSLFEIVKSMLRINPDERPCIENACRTIRNN